MMRQMRSLDLMKHNINESLSGLSAYRSKFCIERGVLKLATIGVLMLQLSLASAAELKLGYVDAARLLDEAPQAGVASDMLKQEFATRENELIAAQQEIKKLEDKLARDGVIMTESEQKKAEQDLLSRKRELRRKQEELKEDFNIRRNDEIGKLQTFIKRAIEEVGKEGKYDLIFYEGISFANPGLDITAKVLHRLGAETKDSLEKPPGQ